MRDNQFESISLAGSAPRGKNEREDLEFEATLRHSDKLIREQQIVTKEIEDKLKTLTDDISISPLTIMKLPYIQHRAAFIKATLNLKTSFLDLLELFHPTPAVGGLPQLKAVEKIKEIELYERKQYAAPIGVISAHFSEFAVGIRSATIDKSTLTLFGGAGIVAGSDADEEWRETGVKMNPFLKVVINDI